MPSLEASKDARSGIVNDPNNPADPEYIIHLLRQVVTVSVKTMALVDELAQQIRQEDWLSESASASQGDQSV
jgi:hypothetical protein